MKKLNQGTAENTGETLLYIPGQAGRTSHFIAPIETGIGMENLRGYTSGLAVPTYIINAPGGGGKTPILPGIPLLSMDEDEITFRTWENRIYKYKITSNLPPNFIFVHCNLYFR